MSEYVRSLMGVVNVLRALIFANSIPGYSFEKQLFTIQEYGKVKNTLDHGSIGYGSHKLIFPIVWKYIMRELKVNSKIRKVLSQQNTTIMLKKVDA